MSDTEKISNTQTISTADPAEKLKGNEKFEFRNVLAREYHSSENIVGLRHVPLETIGREIANSDLSKERGIVVYCAGPECPQSGGGKAF